MMNTTFKPVALALAMTSLAACTSAPVSAPTAAPAEKVLPVEAAPAQPKAEFGQWGVQTEYLSKSIRPQDDFYQYVNEGWLNTARIPPGFPFTGSFVDLMLRTDQQVNQIIRDVVAQKAAAGTPAQQIADMNASYMNVEKRNALGFSMLKADLDAILQRSDRLDLTRRMAQPGYASIVALAVGPDADNPERYVLGLGQGGLGLPGQDYYLKAGEPYAGLRAAYVDYITATLTRAGIKDAQKKAQAILQFETALAGKQWTEIQLRDPVANHAPMTVKELVKYAPGFDWRAFLDAGGYAGVDNVDLGAKPALRDSAALFAKTPLDTLRAYTAFHFLDGYAPFLSEEWENAHFAFHAGKITGIGQQRPREQRAVQLLNVMMGEQVGKLYVERYFPAESKQKIDQLVAFLRKAFRERLQNVDWMDQETRDRAVAKLDAITVKIGYPEKWHDKSGIEIRADDLVGNIRRVNEWMAKDQRAMLDEPLRQWEWGMYPQEINAYYNPLGNEIVFPAAILQPPFFDPKADPAVNFGGIGMVIGHEMGHGFDDQGSRYDGRGALKNWWTDASRQQFEKRTAKLVKEYNAFTPLPGMHVKGKLTLGENIGDLGGMMTAWSGYQKFVAENYAGKAPVLDGYSGNERFFMGYSQLWRGIYEEGFLRQQVLTNPHSPNEYRVNGVLTNFTPWYETFGVKEGDKLFRPESERVRIW